ncbi:DUF805 domain-containing protein [Labrys neptuniae]|uniref:DUF805 domain-containing protein n=1 Tax=Labrys neptuniae TaxID=376174 RepID=A0ABV3PSI1_9HYPH|nr:DUF805 domain-containing protein [Labrys neptuniae]MDT3381600.1 DUF805 domain-containing protein [Labrys neptuniae]
MPQILLQLFREKGRLRRLPYWLGVGLVVGCFALGILIFETMQVGAGLRRSGLMLFFAALLAWLGGRRLSDIGASPWVARVVIFVSGATPSLMFYLVMNDRVPLNGAILVTGAVIMFASACLIILGFIPGKRGANRYGPAPDERMALTQAVETFE